METVGAESLCSLSHQATLLGRLNHHPCFHTGREALGGARIPKEQVRGTKGPLSRCPSSEGELLGEGWDPPVGAFTPNSDLPLGPPSLSPLGHGSPRPFLAWEEPLLDLQLWPLHSFPCPH